MMHRNAVDNVPRLGVYVMRLNVCVCERAKAPLRNIFSDPFPLRSDFDPFRTDSVHKNIQMSCNAKEEKPGKKAGCARSVPG